MSARTKARKRAVDILFEAEQRKLPPVQVLADRVAQSDPAVPEYTVALVEGVTAHLDRIDELLSTYSQGWTLDRMPAVDRALLRIGAFEVLFADDVPDAVASTRRWTSRVRCRPTTRRRSSTACSAGSSS